MKSSIAAIFLFFFGNIFFLVPFQNSVAEELSKCFIENDVRDQILAQVTIGNPEAIKSLPACFKLDHRLIFKATLIDPSQFQNASQILKADKNFVRRLLKVSPEVLKFASSNLRLDESFMEQATYLNRDALQYADPKILDNKIFMEKMIRLDSRNYIFASERLKKIPEIATMAFSDNGLLLQNAPDEIRSNFKLVKTAMQSNSSAIDFASDDLKNSQEIQYLKSKNFSIKNHQTILKKMEEFLQKNYVIDKKRKNLPPVISNRGKFFKKNKIISRNYITKWQKTINYEHPKNKTNLHLITAESRNYQISWQKDFKPYPDLIKKIENFFLKHRLDKDTIDNLSTVYLWKVKSHPLTLSFNLYLLRENDDDDLGDDFADITSLTAIVQKHGKRWEMTVIEVIFDSEMRVEVAYPNGHKKYFLWDLYRINKDDSNPKIVFKVEDRFSDYFEIFEEQNGGKYQMIDRFNPLTLSQ